MRPFPFPIPVLPSRLRPYMVTFFVAFVCCSALAQRMELDEALPPAKIPRVVLRAFATKYPGVKPGYWVQEDQDFEAQFTLKGKLVTAEFTSKGKWVNSETILEEGDLPENAMQYVRDSFGGYFLNIILFEESPVGKFYNVGLTNEEQYEELIFDMAGNFVGRSELED